MAGAPALNPHKKKIKFNYSFHSAPQEQQPNQSHSIKNKSFVFYWWIDGWTVPLGAKAAANQSKPSLPLGRERWDCFVLLMASALRLFLLSSFNINNH